MHRLRSSWGPASRAHRLRPALGFAAVLPFVLVLTGFDLDKGELKCEQAAAHLEACCPELHFDRLSCIQEGGCDREGDETIVASEESDCLRELDCNEIGARGVCERLADRIVRERDPKGPTIQELYEEDWLCD